MQGNRFEDARLEAIMERYKTEILKYQQATPPSGTMGDQFFSIETPMGMGAAFITGKVPERMKPVLEGEFVNVPEKMLETNPTTKEYCCESTVENVDLNLTLPRRRQMFAKGIGIKGDFTPYNDFTNIWDASFLSNPTVQTPVFVRFGSDIGTDGADSARVLKSMSVKFFGEGASDILANHLPVYFLRDTGLIKAFLTARGQNPVTGIHQKDDLWDFCCANPQALLAMLWMSTDLGTPGSYRTLNFYTLPLLLKGKGGNFIPAKVRFIPKVKGGVLSRFEAEELAGCDIDALGRDIKIAVECGERVQFEMAVQIYDDNDFDPFDPTVMWSTAQCPLTVLGNITLTSIPEDFSKETDKVNFDPCCTEQSFAVPKNSPYLAMTHALHGNKYASMQQGAVVSNKEDIRRCGEFISSLNERERQRLLSNLTEEFSCLGAATLENTLMIISDADLSFGRSLALALEG